ncbi:MAG: ribonuclease H-like domain-containing protein [bacterium]|nr:ribonuclease H-like domain-containing protein [bacterium]MBU1428511.1 ribonuclease H-like domain-containing protein [bacterium]MBU2439634.1 ribonuclease H-like domain-containing protein [bacterium]
MDLKSRLEKIDQLKKNINNITQSQKEKSIHIVNQEVKIEEVVSGKFISTPFGESFIRENYFPRDYRCGEVELFQIFQSSTKTISSLARDDRLKEIDINKTVFLDTETTGLAGGAGTYIFLVGVGYFERDQFCIRQYFMRDYNEERALLSALNDLLANFKAVVTYNGKTFDLPLMESRYIMSGMKMSLKDPYHFDLLYPARRLWKRRLESCSLSTVEREILKVSRDDDVPGYLIPEIYFRYLRTKDARAIKQVFEHNLQDILSLVALVSRMCFLVEDPLNNTEYGMDIFSIGKMFDEEKRYEQSTHYYTEALKHNLAEEEALEILRLASFAYKRQGKWEEAEEIWKEIIKRSREFIYFPYEELAKYYEHYLKDYQKAETIVEEALNIEENIFLREKLQYRLNRIKKKR